MEGQEPLTSTMLAAAMPQEQKQMLGERLFPLIQEMYPDSAGKITGMLLEIDNSELLHMLESNESLKAKVSQYITNSTNRLLKFFAGSYCSSFVHLSIFRTHFKNNNRKYLLPSQIYHRTQVQTTL